MKTRISKRDVALATAATALLVLINVTTQDAPPSSPLLAPADELTEHVYIPHLYTPMYTPQAVNLGFEGERDRAARWWEWPSTIAYNGVFSEVEGGEGWTSWWIAGRPCPYANEYVSGRPEVKIIDLDEGFPASYRVFEGTRALQWFTFWRCGYGGVYQQVLFPAGTWRVGVKVHAWHSNCDASPDAPLVLDYDCQTLVDSHMWFRVGVDPEGEENFYSPTLSWGPKAELYGEYAKFTYLWGPWFTLDTQGPHAVTVWLSAESTLPLKHNDAYWDDVVIQQAPEEWWSVAP